MVALPQRGKGRIIDDADDQELWPRGTTAASALADRVPARPESLRERAILNRIAQLQAPGRS